jgi:hypothetical protein
MHDAQCLVDKGPAWKVTTLRRMKYQRSRRLSAAAGELLSFFGLHRTATGRQVQRAFGTRFGTERSARMHLQTLAARGLLEVLRGRDLTGPNIYTITDHGLATVGEDATSQRIRRRRQTGNHIQHELLITEFAIRLAEEARMQNVTISWQARVGLGRHDAFRRLVPDYGFLFVHPEGRQVCLVEISSGEESGTRMLQKLQAYAAWSETAAAHDFLMQLYRDSGAASPRPTFRCLWVLQDRIAGDDCLRLRQLIYAARQLPSEMRNRIWCTTAATLSSATALGLWVRLFDLEPEFLQISPAGPHGHRQLAQRLVAVQRHNLFPTARRGP